MVDPQVPFGVRVPPGRETDPHVRSARLAYHRGMAVAAVFTLVFLQTILLALIALLQAFTSRVRGSLDPQDPTGSALRQARRNSRLLQSVWLMLACVEIGLGWADLHMWEVVHTGPLVSLLGTILPIVFGVGVVFVAARTSNAASVGPSDVTQGAVKVMRPDDDANWRLGAFYVNRDDQRWLVEKRFGVGWTINMAHPLSWVFIAAILAVAQKLPAVQARPLNTWVVEGVEWQSGLVALWWVIRCRRIQTTTTAA